VFCARAIHSQQRGCLLGPIKELPQLTDLILFFKVAVPSHRRVCYECLHLSSTSSVAPDTRIAAASEPIINLDEEAPQSSLGKRTSSQRPVRLKKVPAKLLTDTPPSKALAQNDLSPDTPTAQMYKSLTVAPSPLSPPIFHHVLQDGQSIAHNNPAPVPPLDPFGIHWLQPKAITVMKDAAMAAARAVEKVFPDPAINLLTCGVHATVIWFKNGTHSAFFQNVDAESKATLILEMQGDFNNYRNHCITSSAAPILMSTMLHKWRFVYKQPLVADHWENSWGHQKLTRVEANANNPNRGGFPTDNNAVESANRVDKDDLQRLRCAATPFAQNCVSLALTHSSCDKEFGINMKASVHSQVFMAAVSRIVDATKDNLPTPLSVQWKAQDDIKSIPHGSVIVASSYIISIKCQDSSSPPSIKRIKELCQSEKDQFEKLAKEPGLYAHRTFDELMEMCLRFHVMAPNKAHCYPFATWKMLYDKGYHLISFDELKTKKPVEGFWTCTCYLFRQYSWCKHVCAKAFIDGLILEGPRHLNSRILPNTKLTQGRPRKATGGTNLLKY
jgi:hypothetical protein